MIYLVNMYGTHTQIHTQHTFIVHTQSIHAWTHGQRDGYIVTIYIVRTKFSKSSVRDRCIYSNHIHG